MNSRASGSVSQAMRASPLQPPRASAMRSASSLIMFAYVSAPLPSSPSDSVKSSLSGLGEDRRGARLDDGVHQVCQVGRARLGERRAAGDDDADHLEVVAGGEVAQHVVVGHQ
jgi:hypothetical protein